jgi:hypothetical protein
MASLLQNSLVLPDTVSRRPRRPELMMSPLRPRWHQDQSDLLSQNLGCVWLQICGLLAVFCLNLPR